MKSPKRSTVLQTRGGGSRSVAVAGGGSGAEALARGGRLCGTVATCGAARRGRCRSSAGAHAGAELAPFNSAVVRAVGSLGPVGPCVAPLARSNPSFQRTAFGVR